MNDFQVKPTEFQLAKEKREEWGEVVLASKSPRRRELFAGFGIPFRVEHAKVKEQRKPGETAEDLALRLALEKAREVAVRYPGQWVVGADTVVTGLGFLLEKPANPGQAVSMLHLLKGRTHRVLTAVALVRGENGKEVQLIEESRVTFRNLSNLEILQYAQSGEPLDKAGAYGIQGRAGQFVRRLEGSLSNVIGLPLEKLQEALLQLPGC
jgi:septum formation protein